MKYDFYSRGLRCAVFDMETTGLSPFKNIITCAGIFSPDDGTLFQWFTEEPSDEKRVIAEILEKTADFDTVVTYNGERFDIPFLFARAKRYGFTEKEPLYHVADIYKFLKRYWPAAPLMESLRQKDVEKILGLSKERTDLIDGADCVREYNLYLQAKDEKAKEKILLHNADDVMGLSKITEKLTFLPYDRIAFENGFLIKENPKEKAKSPRKLLIGPLKIKDGKLSATGKAISFQSPASSFGPALRFDVDVASETFACDIMLEKSGEMLFTDLTRLPVSVKNFEAFKGFHSGFLEIEENGLPLFTESSRLMKACIEGLLFEDEDMGFTNGKK